MRVGLTPKKLPDLIVGKGFDAEARVAQATAEMVRGMSFHPTRITDFFSDDEEGTYLCPYSFAETLTAIKIDRARLPEHFEDYLDGHGPAEFYDWKGEDFGRSLIYYALCPLTGLIKIGQCKDARGRLSALNTSATTPISFIGVHPGNRLMERHLHEMFAAVRARKEWFFPHPVLVSWALALA